MSEAYALRNIELGGDDFMRTVLVAILLLLGISSYGRSDEAPPPWAYPVAAPGFKPAPDDGQPRRVPGSDRTYTVPQTRDRFFAPDWHPADHPPMPEVVSVGRKPDVFACGVCHRADGPGGPENASLAGLPEAYIIEQMADFKSGRRGTSVKRVPPALMISLAKAITDEEIKTSAAYFASLKPRATISVVETDTVPKTYVAGLFLADAKSGEREPIAGRIIEVPEDIEQFESRDSHARFIAYVPVGSVEHGKRLAAGENGAACTACHGVGLRGLGNVPALAGRSPSYLFRQLYDMKHGARAGTGSMQMKPVLEQLTNADMTALVAYAASLAP
jgi:cytochrome c553